MPIYDSEGKTLVGVLQSINKQDGFFTKDDEGLLQMISQLASSAIRNSLFNEERSEFNNSLRMLLKTSNILSGCEDF